MRSLVVRNREVGIRGARSPAESHRRGRYSVFRQAVRRSSHVCSGCWLFSEAARRTSATGSTTQRADDTDPRRLQSRPGRASRLPGRKLGSDGDHGQRGGKAREPGAHQESERAGQPAPRGAAGTAGTSRPATRSPGPPSSSNGQYLYIGLQDAGTPAFEGYGGGARAAAERVPPAPPPLRQRGGDAAWDHGLVRRGGLRARCLLRRVGTTIEGLDPRQRRLDAQVEPQVNQTLYAGPGKIGVRFFRNVGTPGVMDDFGGGSIGAPPADDAAHRYQDDRQRQRWQRRLLELDDERRRPDPALLPRRRLARNHE